MSEGAKKPWEIAAVILALTTPVLGVVGISYYLHLGDVRDRAPAGGPGAGGTAIAGQGVAGPALDGQALMTKSDCMLCHDQTATRVGPPFVDIAKRYADDDATTLALVAKIQAGGSGQWGATAMTPHPDLADDQAKAMVTYILSLGDGSESLAGGSAAAPSGGPPSGAILGSTADIPLVAGYRAGLDAQALFAADVWQDVDVMNVPLEAQPMVAPRPATTQTRNLQVQVQYSDEWLAFRLVWADSQPSYTAKLGTFSDAVAVQMPFSAGTSPPPIAMGSAQAKVHLLHWRADYQRDKDVGHLAVEDIYTNSNIDMHPFEFADNGNLPEFTDRDRETYMPAVAAGNPHTAVKTAGIDELVAAGFGTSQQLSSPQSRAQANWQDGQWSVVIARPLSPYQGMKLSAGDRTWASFAVWQGDAQESGSRKSLTFVWYPLALER